MTTLDQDSYNNSDIDLIIFRAAEVMLNYAEALADAGTLTQEDLDLSVNKLRDRVGMPHLSLADANANPDAFLTNPAFGGYQSSVLAADANKGVILESHPGDPPRTRHRTLPGRPPLLRPDALEGRQGLRGSFLWHVFPRCGRL